MPTVFYQGARPAYMAVVLGHKENARQNEALEIYVSLYGSAQHIQ
jgi:hypothetical protein